MNDKRKKPRGKTSDYFIIYNSATDQLVGRAPPGPGRFFRRLRSGFNDMDIFKNRWECVSGVLLISKCTPCPVDLIEIMEV